MKQLLYSKQAHRALMKMPANDAERIEGKLKQLAEKPEELSGNIKRLANSRAYRLKVGNYRVLYDDDGTVLSINEIGARGGIYKRL